METLTITLAGKQYEIRALTVGQLEELHVGVLRPIRAAEEGVRDFWDQNVKLLVTALSVDHPEITVDVVRKMQLGSVKAVREVVAEVLKFAGIADDVKPEAKPGETPSGETPAGAE